MALLEDVIKALERIPLWKRLSALPERTDLLEKRIAALEDRLAGKTGTMCPICNAPDFKRTGSREHPNFGFAGLKLDSYSCASCGHTEERERNGGAH